MKKKLAIFGYGGHAREVTFQIGKPVTFFVDKKYSNEIAKSIEEFDPYEYEIIIAIGECELREKIVKSLPTETTYFTFIHKTAILTDSSSIKIGQGSFIGAYSILTTNIKIGDHAILNRGNQIGHDVNIGNFFSAMPGAIVSGNCEIQNSVYLGTNASIKEKLKIADRTIIGMNSCVIHSILSSNSVYGGVPAKFIKYNN